MAQGLLQQKAAYADLIIRAGLRLRPRQRLLIAGGQLYGVDIHLAPFVRLVAAAAYRAGARLVDVIWDDPQLRLLRFREAATDDAKEHPAWPASARLEFLDQGDAFLILVSLDPSLLEGIDPSFVSSNRHAMLETNRPVADHIERNTVNWCVASAPIPSWASKVFPTFAKRHQEHELWRLILHLCRADQPDPIETWLELGRQLSARAAILTARQYSALTFNAPGTELTVGLPAGHVWHGGELQAMNGITYIPNIPTEEIFTLPHRDRVDGTVSSTRPFSYAGSTIDRFQLTFREGRVVSYSAERGEQQLGELIGTDEGTSRLGEVALVPASSPVSRSGVVLHNALFDENAASHLALGAAYKFTLRDAENLTDADFAAAGGNVSSDHLDLMIGSPRMDVDGRSQDGSSTPIMRQGEWAFDA
ncbi:MAG TPA: aminopeptidase [Anaerolineales bacterium]|nr:aminopeptidase [Anaerolineales bacterium]